MVRIAQAYTRKPRHLRSLISYIAHRNENELIDWLESKNIDTGSNTADVIDAAMWILGREAHKGNFREAIGELYNLHPDKQAILDFFGKKEKQESFLGSEKQKTEKQVSFFKTPLFRLLAVVGVIVILIVIVSKMGD